MTKKNSKEILRADYCLLLKYCRKQCALLSPTRPKLLQLKFNTIMQRFEGVASKRRIEQLNVFDWLSNVKNLVLLNGCEHVRNVIQWD